MTREYSVTLRLDCEDCQEAMAHIVSSRLPQEYEQRWSFHLFRCGNCRREKAIFETMADPRQKDRYGVHECCYCHRLFLDGEPDVVYDNVSTYWWHKECARAQPRPKAIQP